MPTTLAPILAEALEDSDINKEDDEIPKIITTRVKQAQLGDSTCLRVIQKLLKGERKDHEVTLAHATIEDSALFIGKRLWVPESIRTKVVNVVHSTPETGHLGLAKTLFHLKKSYYWPNIHQVIKQFLRNCYPCRKAKLSQDRYYRLLNPL
jgi:hypothetical protein